MKHVMSQKLEMQIPQENAYTGLTTMPDYNEKLTKFLKENFEFPSNNLNEIYEFICKDLELERIIYDLPKIITQELEYTQLSLDFMKETNPNEKILEITIYSNSKSDKKILLQKEDIISDGIIDEYPNTKNEYIILVEPYVE